MFIKICDDFKFQLDLSNNLFSENLTRVSLILTSQLSIPENRIY